MRTKLDKKLASYRLVKDRMRIEKQELLQAEQQVLHVQAAQELVQHIAQKIQQQAHDKIASVVSRCLEAVFQNPYEFKIIFERKRGRTEARLVFERNSVEIDPVSGSGGGVVDVAAFALRLACMLLTRPATRRLVVLDEPFKFLSEQYRPAVRVMLEMLAEEMEVQFIIVSHIEELQTGRVVNISSDHK